MRILQLLVAFVAAVAVFSPAMADECTSPDTYLSVLADKMQHYGTMQVAQLPPEVLASATGMYNARSGNPPIQPDTGLMVGWVQNGEPLPVTLIGLLKDGCMVGGMVRRPMADGSDA